MTIKSKQLTHTDSNMICRHIDKIMKSKNFREKKEIRSFWLKENIEERRRKKMKKSSYVCQLHHLFSSSTRNA